MWVGQRMQCFPRCTKHQLLYRLKIGCTECKRLLTAAEEGGRCFYSQCPHILNARKIFSAGVDQLAFSDTQ